MSKTKRTIKKGADMNLKKLVGTKVYELRIGARLTQEQVAEISNVSNDTISRIERGQRSPSFKVIPRLAKALGVEVRELFDFSGREFVEKEYRLELIDLLNYLNDKPSKDIKMLHKIARLVLERKER